MEFIELCQHLSNVLENQNQNQRLNLSLNILSSLIIGYTVLSILTKRSAFLLAFLLCVFLQSATIMLIVSESVVYLLVFVVYSYVFQICRTSKSKISCVTILLLSLILYIDTALFGIDGIYGESQTIIYEMGDYLSLLAHFFFICSFINTAKIRDYLCGITSAFNHLSRSIYYMFDSWYNIR
tara:strand:+ start:581 stop:1126 length:546 start_codon:yes stop_codon:yes gene_type:complete